MMTDNSALKQMDSMVSDLFYIREKMKRLKDELTKLNHEKNEIEFHLMDYLEDAGLNKFDGKYGSFSFTYHESVKVPATKEARQAFFDYLAQTGQSEELVTVNSQRLNRWFKEEKEMMMVKGDLNFRVPGLEDPTPYRKATLRKK